MDRDVISPPKSKLVTIYPTPRTMSVQKLNSIKHVAHEPIKGTVHPVVSTQSTVLPSLASEEYHRADTVISKPVHLLLVDSASSSNDNRDTKNVNPTVSSSFDLKTTTTSRKLVAKHAASNVAILEPCVNLEHSSKESSVFRQPVFSQDRVARHDCLESEVPTTCAVNFQRTETMQALAAQRMATSQSMLRNSASLSDVGSTNVSSEINNLREQLEIQTKVNADLKKLLVASIGDDLHYKVDALVRTKVQLANEIGDYTRKLVEDYEDLDKITIQADLWHSKYQASRVLAEQLMSERDHIGYICSQSQTALQALLDERRVLHQQLLHLNKSLHALHAMFAPTLTATQFPASEPRRENYLELTKNCNKLMDGICFTLLGNRPACENNAEQDRSLSPAEQCAQQAMSAGIGSVHVGEGLTCSRSSTSLSHMHAFPRFHPGARYCGFTLSCCKHCTGELHAV